MESIPWYAWIVLVAIVVGAVVQLARMSKEKSVDHSPDLRSRVISLEQRVEHLERR